MVRACEKQLSHQHCHDKIAFCWHSWAAPKVAPLQDFYPGDDLVDWIGISIFQQLYPWANAETIADFVGGSLDQVQEVFEFAKEHDKPIMIAESTPFGGEGMIKVIYLVILLTHIALAIAIVPLVLISFSRALSNRFDKHKKIARTTLALSLKVTETAVTVHLMISPYY